LSEDLVVVIGEKREPEDCLKEEMGGSLNELRKRVEAVVEEIVVGEKMGWVIVVVGEEVGGEGSAGTSGTPRFLEMIEAELFPPPRGGRKEGRTGFLIGPSEKRRAEVCLGLLLFF
jgi:hypothetical protein